MSYLRTIEYTITPDKSFQILRNCSGCGCKTVFRNTNCFRVNANGNKIDVWLIYQCIKCKHTSNLSIYERCRPGAISKEEYEGYLRNCDKLAFKYGTDSKFFARNRVEVDWLNVDFSINRSDGVSVENTQHFHEGDLVVIYNSYALKIRTDKVVSEVLMVTRSKVKGLEESGVIVVKEEREAHKIIIEIKADIL